ncbi:lipid IV(A) 3-deoxy-D-manno-octulosonic acid transferase [Vibrio sp. ZSDE26]|uniref:3-deoxy-D-manno-octulosonic acid transferase n=1 Tax=Vibrio amylolyticus TaxID=2847292 RepID=A0A9X2BJA7_9VIBR|nr:lipid IV(A) 3-deoxy-D-manno-octulosonic acid transferase [Vibrio amylolyticus]MCK6263272.1 lipid IV(A) 3-deoxy-D-manno-octulosonic acid transferase [Vibrio amylolyticus]
MAGTMIRWLYTLALALVSPILLWGLYRKKPNKPIFGERWKEHFGYTPDLDERREGVIWLHAVSVGEVLASKVLLERIQILYPHKRILVTTTTSTGAEQVVNLEGNIVHRYMPIDFSWCINRFLKIIQPDLFIIVETEIWPNTLHNVSKHNVPIVLINGRLSEKSEANYKKFRKLISPALNNLQMILTVHNDDKGRFNSLVSGLDKVKVTGSIKYDVSLDERILVKGKALRSVLGLERKVWIAASTHQGEDELIIKAYNLAKKHAPELLLVIVPRHPERFNQVAKLVGESGLTISRRTDSNDAISEKVDVYLGDTMGEMMVLLAASDLVFMGGSLIGNKVGGHNFIEPALLSKPCLTGPSYFNFSDLANQLISHNALSVVSSSEELASLVTSLFSDSRKMASMGQHGYDIVQKNQGALQRTLNTIEQVISKSS